MNKTVIYIVAIFLSIMILWILWGFFGSRVEQLDYTVIKKMDGYEIRKYSAHIVAQTTVKGSYGESLNSGFGIVAGYIFGANTKKESIAMTAPVVAQNIAAEKVSENIAMTAPVVATTDGDFHTISFSMPRSYTLKTLPIPDDPRVKIAMIPAKSYAVATFSWYRSDTRIRKVQQKLLSSLARDAYTTNGNVAYAGYNAPFTPPWMLRNEVLVELNSDNLTF